MKKLIILAIACVLLTSCNNDFYHLVSRTTLDPLVSTPQPSFFDEYAGVRVEWTPDPGADEYFLYRSSNPDTGYSLVYQGQDTSYLDTKSASIIEENFYFYKLAKRRGQKSFPLSAYAIGTFGVQLRDPGGINDEITQAQYFDRGWDDVIYYYRDTHGEVRSDTDWYYVVVPKNTTYHFRLTYTGAQNPVFNSNIYLTFFESGNTLQLTTNLTWDLQIQNLQSTDQVRKFALSYVPSSGVSAPNNYKIPYQLKFDYIIQP